MEVHNAYMVLPPCLDWKHSGASLCNGIASVASAGKNNLSVKDFSAIILRANRCQSINEDLQYSMLLAQQGWDRQYVEDVFILTKGPESFRQWMGQRVRHLIRI
jgi:hypothetical protein